MFGCSHYLYILKTDSDKRSVGMGWDAAGIYV